MMKKSTRKLAIRHETLRVLAELDLSLVAGGDTGAQQAGTGGPETGCPIVKAADSVGPGCLLPKR